VWHGVVSQPELFAAFQSAAFLVLPTLCDGFGSVVPEALANGLPVITTTNAGAADVIEEGRNGFVVPPADSGALADRIEWCLSHPMELIKMRRNSVMTARRWTWVEFRAALRAELARQFGDAALAAIGPIG
jgi:glycosyltransferase involved in cell wall biosynthesis